MYNEKVPKINKKYIYFDDGKIHEGRQYQVKILEIIAFDNIDDITFQLWNEEIIQCPWLYNVQTDYFITAIIDNGNDDMITFVRTVDNRWFSLGYWGGVLDVDGSLVESIQNA